MSHLSRKDLDELKPSVDKAVYKVLGESDSHLVSTALHCLASGYDHRKTTDKLCSYIDSKKASRISDKLFDLLDDLRYNSKKRGHDERDYDRDNKRPKSKHYDERERGDDRDRKVKEMMKSAQRQIEERKRTLPDNGSSNSSKNATEQPVNIPTPSIYGIPMGLLNRGDADKARKIAQLQAQIKNKLSMGILGNVVIQMPVAVDKPTPLILDEEGRTVDKSGKAVQLTHVAPTLKANIRAKKREQFKSQHHEKNDDSNVDKFYDYRLSMKPALRNKRTLRFHEPGKFQQLAERLRMKAQLEKLQNEISQIAKKTGISSATKLALIAKSEGLSEDIPQMEWWDSVILLDDLDTVVNGKIAVKESVINNLVEHPTQVRCPFDPLRPVYMPVFLTKKERKKLRRQNRREMWKEEQEKIRLGLEAPPEPKLRISNLMRVLGTEAVQDPTKIEAHVREQMAKRQKAHEEANASRRLTADQKRDKKIKKIKEDTSTGVYVSVFRIRELHELASKKFKVETNAKQLFMTGCVLMYPDCCVVVVEGGPKQQKKYKRLMLHRIKWEEDTVKDPDGNEVPNKCTLVWEGTSKQRNFGEIKFKVVPTERMAREHFKKHKVEHYWDLAYSGAVLEPTIES
ncbi:U4/U6 small nuclear ribonucleoprotein Prp3 [Onthophagus taurus]|uniref:U4/U6 small nuclear ribonucleoprotein Prp3 n=1 Tax=Onthophagus taurus TaxID=166361 RepID=UPI000C203A63|nr:U4/U6 small nuclear ribonucleoprotein Prp3 isoform X1 [Onthophagus taurus]XP_022908183.1 U4/U6 small nuclear ribonucleoprotein Prp3 isoform X2 [Onthophagus taurus]